MHKDDLIEIVMNKANSSKAEAKRLLDTVFNSIVDALKKGDEVSISGFGTFKTSKRAARMGVNPKTGEKIQIAEKTVPKFKAGKHLKDAVK